MATMVAALPYVVFAVFFFLVAVIVTALVFSQRDEQPPEIPGEALEEFTYDTQAVAVENIRSVTLPNRKDPLWRVFYKDGRRLVGTGPVWLILKGGEDPQEALKGQDVPPLALERGRRKEPLR
ncbi:MAG TPA: hypothetical protein PLB81_08990 [Deltaproteobacteria bacterium]|nr:hypothetical protein [Deltaproteobacteria bacterium]